MGICHHRGVHLCSVLVPRSSDCWVVRCQEEGPSIPLEKIVWCVDGFLQKFLLLLANLDAREANCIGGSGICVSRRLHCEVPIVFSVQFNEFSSSKLGKASSSSF